MKCKLKICGVTNKEDAHSLVKLGVDAIGVNFWNKSKRFIDPQNAQPFLQEIRDQIHRVGVFVNEDISNVIDIFNSGLIDSAQLHGDESTSYCEQLRKHEVEYIKVIRIPTGCSEIILDTYAPEKILLDTLVTGFGGEGKCFDWKLATTFIQSHPHKNVILAGGINQSNIKQAKALNPYMLDIASGAEHEPGLKDLSTIKAMLNILNES